PHGPAIRKSDARNKFQLPSGTSQARAVQPVRLAYAQERDFQLIVREQDEQESHKQQLQIVAPKTGRGQRLVELAHQLQRFHIGRGLEAVQPRLNAKNESERLDIVLEVAQDEPPFTSRLQVEQMPSLEVARQDISGALGLRQPVVIIERLSACFSQV